MRTVILAALVSLALVAVPVAAGQGIGNQHATDSGIANGSKQRALASARKQWRARGVASYAFKLTVSCFCPPRDDMKIVVRKGRPAPYTPKDVRDQATVPRLFATIQDAIDRKVAKLLVTYGDRGVPRSIYVDTDERIADEEIGYKIRGFTPLKG